MKRKSVAYQRARVAARKEGMDEESAKEAARKAGK